MSAAELTEPLVADRGNIWCVKTVWLQKIDLTLHVISYITRLSRRDKNRKVQKSLKEMVSEVNISFCVCSHLDEKSDEGKPVYFHTLFETGSSKTNSSRSLLLPSCQHQSPRLCSCSHYLVCLQDYTLLPGVWMKTCGPDFVISTTLFTIWNLKH